MTKIFILCLDSNYVLWYSQYRTNVLTMKTIKRKTTTRDRILGFIKEFFAEKGYTPTVRDIVKGCNISTTSVVQHHLNRLEKDGLIQRDPQIFRSIRLTEKPVLEGEVPLLGTIAAGEPIAVPAAETWHSEAQDTLKVPPELIDGKVGVFALKVKGLSMIDALIDDGDIVLLQPAKRIHDGDTVAVWLKDRQEVTLKKLYKEGDNIRLQPANQTMSPIFTKAENVEVQGKLVGVIRKV
jgi:repressor LexA